MLRPERQPERERARVVGAHPIAPKRASGRALFAGVGLTAAGSARRRAGLSARRRLASRLAVGVALRVARDLAALARRLALAHRAARVGAALAADVLAARPFVGPRRHGLQRHRREREHHRPALHQCHPLTKFDDFALEVVVLKTCVAEHPSRPRVSGRDRPSRVSSCRSSRRRRTSRRRPRSLRRRRRRSRHHHRRSRLRRSRRPSSRRLRHRRGDGRRSRSRRG